jgi:hypothetical protein
MYGMLGPRLPHFWNVMGSRQASNHIVARIRGKPVGGFRKRLSAVEWIAKPPCD